MENPTAIQKETIEKLQKEGWWKAYSFAGVIILGREKQRITIFLDGSTSPCWPAKKSKHLTGPKKPAD